MRESELFIGLLVLTRLYCLSNDGVYPDCVCVWSLSADCDQCVLLSDYSVLFPVLQHHQNKHLTWSESHTHWGL